MLLMAKNSNADNDYWEIYKREGVGFRGDPEELEELVTEETNVRILRNKIRDDKKIYDDELE